MADKEKGKEKALKTRQLKQHFKRSNANPPFVQPSGLFNTTTPSLRTSHDAPPVVTSHNAHPPSTSHVAHPPKTSNVAFHHISIPLRTSRTSATTPSPRTSHVTPLRGVDSPSNSQPSQSEGVHSPRSNEIVIASETQSNGGKRTLYLDGEHKDSKRRAYKQKQTEHLIVEVLEGLFTHTDLNGIPPSHSDLFLHTHKRGKDKTWIDRRSEYVHEKFKRRFKELTQETTSQGTPPPNELNVWCEVAGIKGGRVYGLRMESTVLLGRPNYRGSCSSSTKWVQRHEFEEMRNERDQLREELANTNRAVERNNHLIKQLVNSLNFKPMPYTRDQIHEDEISDNDDEIGEHGVGDFDDEIADNDARDHDGEELDG
uniref:Uncharacterized protein LOC113787760 n=1 Tax=Cicer arietinum TaxID=3827 RepID=A0A3Q7YDY1_CICAR|nr:uncharacterized protein LOC113787760 [Cicer arietinum]